MLRKQLIDDIQSRLDGVTKKQVDLFIDAFENSICDAMKKGEEVKISGFGTFKTRKMKSYKTVNPAKQKPMTVPERTIAYFKPGRNFKSSTL